MRFNGTSLGFNRILREMRASIGGLMGLQWDLMIYINGNNADSNGYNGDINYMVTTVEMEDYTTCNTWGIDGI